jgi:hypothetical protein
MKGPSVGTNVRYVSMQTRKCCQLLLLFYAKYIDERNPSSSDPLFGFV